LPCPVPPSPEFWLDLEGSDGRHYSRLSGAATGDDPVRRGAEMDSSEVDAPAPDAGLVLPRSLCDKVDVLRGHLLEVTQLSGGLTNRNYKVSTPEGTYVVRISGGATGALAIDRENEYRNSLIAAESGVGAPVLAYIPEESALVIGYLEGRTFTDADFGRPGVVERVAASCRRLHSGARFVNEFDMFDIQSGYLAIVRHRGYRLPDSYLDFGNAVDRIRGALAVKQAPTVACNNDLLAGNFIDDGERIRLIDYEYSGNNDPCFELGNIWSECHLDDDQLELLVSSYYTARLANKLARARLWGLLSQYGWTLWASIQEATSDIEFDFWPWGLEKYERAVATFRGPLLDGLIADVQRDD
jgi:thiamine kinase-like enzyme